MTDMPRNEPRPPENNSRSTTTVLALLLAFVGGLLIGFAARPFVDRSAGLDERTEAALAAIATLEAAGTGGQPAAPSPAQAAELAAAILPNMRHVQGDPNAPVTLVEFSDFQ